MSILTNIRTLYSAMTPSGRCVADYVLSHADEVVYMPITELAYRCSVSESSIMRFCRVAGMSGYQDFRLMLSSALAAEKQSRPVDEAEQDSSTQLMQNVFSSFHTILKGTMEMLKPDMLTNIAKCIHQAGQIFLFGSRDAINLTASFCQVLMRSFHKGLYISDGYSQGLLLASITHKDLAIFLSVHNNDPELYRLAEQAKNKRARLLSITCCGPTGLDSLCNEVLYCGRTNPVSSQDGGVNEASLNFASVSFLMATLHSFCMEEAKNDSPSSDFPSKDVSTD